MSKDKRPNRSVALRVSMLERHNENLRDRLNSLEAKTARMEPWPQKCPECKQAGTHDARYGRDYCKNRLCTRFNLAVDGELPSSKAAYSGRELPYSLWAMMVSELRSRQKPTNGIWFEAGEAASICVPAVEKWLRESSPGFTARELADELAESRTCRP